VGETALFTDFIQRTAKLLADLRAQQNDWQFVETALDYFIKAFFTPGLEQLLWHITTLEALLAEKGVTERLARRIVLILEKNTDERETLRKRFKDLYAFRSDLAHGNQFQMAIYTGHLSNARDLARRTLLWFLHYPNHIQNSIPESQVGKSIPSRDDILILLDMNQESRKRLSRFIERLPPGFPNVLGWV
jgi:hypothetical protein